MAVSRVEADRLATVAVDWVAARLAEGTRGGDVAALSRVHAVLLPLHIGLLTADIPAASEVGAQLLDRTGARAALAWLRLATSDRLDGDDVAEAAKRSPRTIRRETLRGLASRVDWTPGRLRDHTGQLTRWEAKHLRGWLDDLGSVRQQAASGGARAALTAVEQVLPDGLRQLEQRRTASKVTNSHPDDVSALIQVAPLQPDRRRSSRGCATCSTATPPPRPSAVA